MNDLNMSVKFLDDGSLEFDKYVTRGNMMYLREGLSLDDPDNLYNYLKSNDVDPELYGIFHPFKEKYKDWSKEQLLSKVCELESIISKHF